MKKDLNIYIDFDRTLFDTDNFLKDLETIIYKYVSKNKYNLVLKKLKYYNIFNIIENLSLDKNLFNDVLNNTNKYLFPDTITFLDFLKENNFKINILSRGDIEYQNFKIKSCGLNNYFNEIIICLDNKTLNNIDYHTSLFIDDNPKDIIDLREKRPLYLFRIKRENTKYSKIKISNVLEFNNLEEIKSKITTIV